MNKPANIPTPPAYDVTDEGLRIWQGGEVVDIIPKRYYGNLIKDLLEQMRKDVKNDERR